MLSPPWLARMVVTLCLLQSHLTMAAPPDGATPNEQRGNAGQNQASLNLVTEFDGKLKSLEGGILSITRDDGTEILVKPPEDRSKFQFLADAKLEFLRPGMWVRFRGTFNRAGVAQSPIAEVELIQPMQGKVPQNQRHRFVPGVHVDDSSAQQANPSAEPSGGPAIANCDVVGSLTGIDQAGVMSVQAGRIPVLIPLVPTARFKIRFHDLSLAQPGDPVKVSGFYNPPDDTKVVADSITVQTDRVYGDPPVEELPNRRSSRRARRSQAGQAGQAGQADGTAAASGGASGE